MSDIDDEEARCDLFWRGSQDHRAPLIVEWFYTELRREKIAFERNNVSLCLGSGYGERQLMRYGGTIGLAAEIEIKGGGICEILACDD